MDENPADLSMQELDDFRWLADQLTQETMQLVILRENQIDSRQGNLHPL